MKPIDLSTLTDEQTTLALIKPPKGSDEKQVRKYLRDRLAEFGII
jgi:hypothetical protein